MSKHTPGPWETGKQNGHGGISIEANINAQIATVYLGIISSNWKRGKETFARPENAEALANARLIAAAPELLEACEAALNYMINNARSYGGDENEFPSVIKLRDAIAKATGE